MVSGVQPYEIATIEKDGTMRIAKRSTLFLILTFGLVACADSGPDTVALSFLEAIHAGDVDEAIGHLSAEAFILGESKLRASFAMASNEFRRETRGHDVHFSARVVEIDGDFATIAVNTYFDGEDEGEEMVQLIREDGEWKVGLGDFAK